MQQHSGQHVLSAAFEKLYNFPTVSFHMGDDLCTIDLATDALNAKQLESAERLANEVMPKTVRVEIRFATPDEARAMGVRKIPPAVREKLRLIDIRDFDLNACGGTHVRSTGQIGAILLRKTEKVKQGVRVEFVCGLRAVSTARRDFQTLTTPLPQSSPPICGRFPSRRANRSTKSRALRRLSIACWKKSPSCRPRTCFDRAAERPSGSGHKLVVEFFADRDLGFIKMLAQKLIRLESPWPCWAVGARSPPSSSRRRPVTERHGRAHERDTAEAGNSRGGNRDMAQGGAPDGPSAEQALREAASAIG